MVGIVTFFGRPRWKTINGPLVNIFFQDNFANKVFSLKHDETSVGDVKFGNMDRTKLFLDDVGLRISSKRFSRS